MLAKPYSFLSNPTGDGGGGVADMPGPLLSHVCFEGVEEVGVVDVPGPVPGHVSNLIANSWSSEMERSRLASSAFKRPWAYKALI
jgi:hypothetical protein